MLKKFAFFVLNPFIQATDGGDWLGDFSLKKLLDQTHTKAKIAISDDTDPKLLMNIIGTQKIIDSNSKKLLDFLENDFEKSKIQKTLTHHMKTHGGTLHLLMALSDVAQLLPLFLAKWEQSGPIFLHLVINAKTKEHLLKQTALFEKILKKHQHLTLASLAGAQNIFGQTGDRKELQKWYDEIVFNQTQTSFSLETYLEKQFENEINPELIAPVSFVASEQMKNGDAIMILETDAEKITMITQAFEVSKNEEKKSDFPLFSPIFITKSLPDLLIITAKNPYPSYHNLSLIAPEKVSTLTEKIAKNELRQLYLGDTIHLKLISKYLNNENEIVYDGQRNRSCDPILADNKTTIQSANEKLLTLFEQHTKLFEAFFFAAQFEEEEKPLFEKIKAVCSQEKIDLFVLDCCSQALWIPKEKEISELPLEKIGALLEESLELHN